MPIQGVLSKGRVPVKIWAPMEEVESAALDQLHNLSCLPFVFKHVAAMPDVHLGKGATVGSVVATERAICPAAVGVDIGCGMFAVRTNLDHRVVQEKIKEIRHSIERSIPVGHEGNRKISDSVEKWMLWPTAFGGPSFDKGLLAKAKAQLGSLGGGNHFIEICLDQGEPCNHGSLIGSDCSDCQNTGFNGPPNVWVMLHSGSRNVGKTLAERHINEAKGIMKQMFVKLPDPDLAYLAEGTEAFSLYMADLEWAQQYAWQNRIEMMSRIFKDLAYAVNAGKPVDRIMEVHCHHNYVSREHHYGRNVLVTRKGAVRARRGEYGIIPGSMGARSYIVRGLGCEESFTSCSHGAGRRMSRSRAKATFSLDDLERQTSGVECRKDSGVIDEIPGAYKDIDRVMMHQRDLVETVAILKQIMCIKG